MVRCHLLSDLCSGIGWVGLEGTPQDSRSRERQVSPARSLTALWTFAAPVVPSYVVLGEATAEEMERKQIHKCKLTGPLEFGPPGPTKGPWESEGGDLGWGLSSRRALPRNSVLT